ncbi:unnamed protein product [Citrullus colocynthis]|uniref:Uncharacterized protein n=1 Tax=Citrullus colocynthis TaxID=252529 RepID=A0ABP0Y718_9ROSI
MENGNLKCRCRIELVLNPKKNILSYEAGRKLNQYPCELRKGKRTQKKKPQLQKRICRSSKRNNIYIYIIERERERERGIRLKNPLKEATFVPRGEKTPKAVTLRSFKRFTPLKKKLVR